MHGSAHSFINIRGSAQNPERFPLEIESGPTQNVVCFVGYFSADLRKAEGFEGSYVVPPQIFALKIGADDEEAGTRLHPSRNRIPD